MGSLWLSGPDGIYQFPPFYFLPQKAQSKNRHRIFIIRVCPLGNTTINFCLFSTPGYVVRWKYCVKRTGVKSLKGKASRIEDVGRDKIVYFFWQGQDSTVNEKGAAALMTVELDSDRGPQVSCLLNTPFL